jgi:hypothetical protein
VAESYGRLVSAFTEAGVAGELECEPLLVHPDAAAVFAAVGFLRAQVEEAVALAA